MDIAIGKAKYTTTVQIPMQLRQEIKGAGMTVGGALITGWAAIKERKDWNLEIQDLRKNVDKYRVAYISMRDRVAALEKIE